MIVQSHHGLQSLQDGKTSGNLLPVPDRIPIQPADRRVLSACPATGSIAAVIARLLDWRAGNISKGTEDKAENIDDILKSAYEDFDGFFNDAHDELDKLAIRVHSEASSATTPRAQAPSLAMKPNPKKNKGNNH